MLVHRAIAELLRRSDARVVFGLTGSSNVTWLADGAMTGAFRFVRTRHEETACAAATAYARVTGGIGVATATIGPGFANTVNAMGAAAHDHVPVVLITGHGKRSLNQRGIAEAIGIGYHEASGPDDVEQTFWNAICATWNGTPQVLSFDEAWVGDDIELTIDPASQQIELTAPDADAVAAAVDALERADHPLIIAGWGAHRAGCRDELWRLADLTGARVATTLHAHRFFRGHPADLGVCGDSSPPVVLEELAKTDVVLAVGASLDRRTTSGNAIFPGATIIQCEIDLDRDFKASSPELGLLGDAREAVRAITAEWERRGLGPRPVRGDCPTRAAMKASVLSVEVDRDPDRGLDVRHVYDRLDELLPPDRIVVGDAGRAWRTLPTMLDAQDNASWINSRGYNSIGLGMGAAIGAAVASPGRPVALFCGDGGFTMAAQELDSIRLNELSITVVVLNDEQYGSELHYLDDFSLPYDVVRQPMVDTARLAQVYGGDGVVLRTREDLDNLKLPGEGLFVVRADIDPDVNWATYF